MANKNSSQTILPFDTKGKDLKPYVKQHWNATFARQKKVSVYAKRIMAYVLGKIDPTAKDFAPYYQFHVSEILDEDQASGNFVAAVRKAFDEITDLKWHIEDVGAVKGKETFTFRHLIDTTSDSFGYKSGVITIVLNKQVKDYFIALAHYTTYDLSWYMKFSSWYSMRLFEMLSAFKDKGIWTVEIGEFRTLMDCESLYKDNDAAMIKATTTKPLLELEHTRMAFTMTVLKGKKIGEKGRKSIEKIEFRLKKVEVKTIPDAWYKNEKAKKLIERMTKRYQISQANVVKYSVEIGQDAIRKLLNTWDVKEASADPIKNKLKYCNSVFVAMGKEAIEDKKV